MCRLCKILAIASKHTPPNTQRTPTHPWLRPPTTTTTTHHHTTPTTHRHRRPPHERTQPNHNTTQPNLTQLKDRSQPSTPTHPWLRPPTTTTTTHHHTTPTTHRHRRPPHKRTQPNHNTTQPNPTQLKGRSQPTSSSAVVRYGPKPHTVLVAWVDALAMGYRPATGKGENSLHPSPKV